MRFFKKPWKLYLREELDKNIYKVVKWKREKLLKAIAFKLKR